MNFFKLHQQAKPLLMANVWDVSSIQAAEETGYDAVGTSSAAIAAMYGYEDGENISFSELRQLITRLQTLSKLPLSVDLEAGYSALPEKIVENITILAKLGVVGVNLEDSIVQSGKRTLMDRSMFITRLQSIRKGLIENNVSMFINIRTDTFLLNIENALEETILRGKCYATHGADGLFVPCIVTENDISTVVKAVPLPLNVMCMPNLPSFETLARLGVKRISMGNMVHVKLQCYLKEMLSDIYSEQSFKKIFHHENNR
ncbi:isocitrate lyase/phosphoenolpyruvate mutase family protein [Salmonella enterica subsp. enterica serovar Newport]|uniref:Isocitrate lyase/phosphoenolpyruvate mutase family protein n=1 Tax=Salmonella newport TaxID=108619 RepID=A0A5U9KH68_SALNE|nr:isocitrate lyase/phosphoenolpyruvate mutase family protein [Salmonella enterica subsp. enterica serovar Newport]EDX0052030.1 isocitrate lyase/phosphoenolpyruvate mutase family protein [Salmonella enterica]ECN8538439.1 isocitrate lyase/phosphoenolpyruvate mutase family protein [Salmonella enterica subsp. enterica serovar Newport]EGF7279311.1 isocitrate lyase/phosphoenolpyruvate mutase family protein [Salmonella enterica]EJH8881650.1 isocitrate lyase/phosphoenolpyruvate mutase family protein [